MRKYDVIVQKIIYRNKKTAYSVFSGVVLKWAPRKKVFVPTKEIRTFVGYFFCLFQGDRLSLEADEVFNPTFGTQCHVNSSQREEPASSIEIRNFLLKNIKGMTPKRVEKIMDKYGLDAIHAFVKDSHAYDFLGLSQDALNEIHSELTQNRAFEDTMTYLQLHDLDCRFALPLHQKYGSSAVLTVEDNPYIPYMDGIFDFRIADRLYLSLGKDASAPKRCLYTTLASIRMDAAHNGNVFTRRKNLREKMIGFLTETANGQDREAFPFPNKDIDEAVAKLENSGHIIVDSAIGEDVLYLRESYYDEKKIGSCLKEFMNEPKRIAYRTYDIDAFLTQYQASTGCTLDAAQRKAVLTALTSPACVISGGPGTGKTHTINTIIAAIRALTPDAVIRACAPTGKAAIRITELTGMPASTIHRALGLGRYKGALSDGDLVCDFMFVDEFSMVDLQLCAKLFDAVNTCGRIIMVGDYNQLPSVGPGLVLRDFIASGAIPTIILNKIFRQKGGSRIVENSHRIINQVPGQDIRLLVSRNPGEDFYFIPEDDPRKIIELVKRSIAQAKRNYGYGLDSVQVLSPVHFGDLGVDNLNCVLQQALNPGATSIQFEDHEFRLGDKVTHIQNDYDLEVFNGEVGTVSAINYTKDKALMVTYPDRDVWYPFTALSELELAYALTVHKLQGSEYPVIIMPVHEFQGQGLSKNLLYTALTRAKKMVILIGSRSALSTGLRRETTIERESNLVGRIQTLLPPAKYLV